MKVLILGYGNIDRQDDGVAWHVLVELMKQLGATPPALEDEMPLTYGDYEFQFHLQLTPELADELGKFDKVVLIDAHTGNVPEEIHQEIVSPGYQFSPFTHHMTAATLLSLCEVIHHGYPESLLISVRGYEFQFMRSLSDRTQGFVEEAVKQIIDWINL